MKYDNNFLGFNGFIWFNGVVEDRNDPQKLDKSALRWYSYARQGSITHADLPWAESYFADNLAISGLEKVLVFFVEGSWVFGYFRDGRLPRTYVISSLLECSS